MSAESVRFALMGCGRISLVHLECLRRHPRAELVGVADVDGQAARDVAEAWGAEAFDDPQKMLETVQPDAVLLCTPPDSHRDLAIAALESGSHVLCEKPLTVSEDAAREMHEAADRAGRTLVMASKFRFVDDMITARAFVRSGNLGEILALDNEFTSFVDMKDRWNSDRAVAGGGVLIDNGTHSADIVRYLLGPVVGVHAVEGRRWQPLQVEDSCTMLCRVESGTTASIDLSWSIQKLNPWYVSIYGTEGVLQIGWKESRFRQTAKAEWAKLGSGYDKFQAVGSQLDNFIETIEGRAESLIGFDAALASIRVVDAAYRSLERGQWEPVRS
jgi:predicted dehydrogenase